MKEYITKYFYYIFIYECYCAYCEFLWYIETKVMSFFKTPLVTCKFLSHSYYFIFVRYGFGILAEMLQVNSYIYVYTK